MNSPRQRRKEFTAIQNGFVSPATALRLPLWSQVQPVRPCEIGTCIWCWSVVVGWIPAASVRRISTNAVPAAISGPQTCGVPLPSEKESVAGFTGSLPATSRNPIVGSLRVTFSAPSTWKPCGGWPSSMGAMM